MRLVIQIVFVPVLYWDDELYGSCNTGYKPLFSQGLFGSCLAVVAFVKIPKMQKWLPELAKPCCTHSS